MWAAANVQRKESQEAEGGARAESKKRVRGETTEAVLSRLTKSWSLFMECLGAMHEANVELMKRKSEDLNDESLQSLRNVTLAARNMLERAILLDPLIVEHAPCLRETIQQFADRENASSGRWKLLCAPRPEPPKISSKAHRATIRQLAYLSLTNYADLLMSVCTCSCNRVDHAQKSEKLLDRGVVKKLQSFNSLRNVCNVECCWEGESEEDIQRLALVALSDASTLDGSDPVVWVKLACAARAMGHIKALPDQLANPMLSSYRRLERHALEKGYTALPSNVPPNRIIARLLDEFNKEEPPDSYSTALSERSEPSRLSLDLTRYSWAILGRVLMKACREGTAADHGHGVPWNRKSKFSTVFASPVMHLGLSPMLLLPSNVILKLLSYLPPEDIWKLEATCRALSVSIMSARAANEKQDAAKAKQKTDELIPNQNEDITANSQPGSETNPGGSSSQPDHDDPPQGGEHSRAGRTSKRVRSQQLSSDKKEERLRRRNSVAFCLRAATLSCTADDDSFKASLKAPESWDSVRGELWKLPASLEGYSASQKEKPRSLAGSRGRNEASERTGPSSLPSFLQRWNLRNEGPIDMLLKYLGHVALHVEDVFQVDPADTMALASCVMGCFELVLQRKFQNSLLPTFFSPIQDLSTVSLEQTLQLFATDVLHVELRFKRTERQHHVYVSFEDDSNFVSCMVPHLLDGIVQLDEICAGSEHKEDWTKLKARTFWLTAGMFLWRSRFSNSVSESIKAEEEGLKYIESTIKCLDQPTDKPIKEIPTPHLESPGRMGGHWKKLCPEGLAAYRDEIQASSVVSLAQQQFQERISAIMKRNKETDETVLNDEDVRELARIGDSLLDPRYMVPFGAAECRLGELLDNFLFLHADDITFKSFDNVHDRARDKLVPSKVDIPGLAGMSSPSILTILVSCLRAEPTYAARVTTLLIRLVLTTLDRHKQICMMGETGNGGSGGPQNEFSDSDDESTTSDVRMDGNGESEIGGYASNALKCGRFAKFLIDRVRDSLICMEDGDEKTNMTHSDEFIRMLHHCLAFCADWVVHFAQKPAVIEESIDLHVFQAVKSLMALVSDVATTDKILFLKKLYFRGIVRVVCSQHQSFSSLARVQGTVRARRAVRQRICVSRAKFIGEVFCEIGDLLSQNLIDIEPDTMKRSDMVETDVFEDSNDGSFEVSWPADLSRFCAALLWFWDYSGAATKQSDAATSSSFDRPIIDRLRIPLATAIIGFCGSASCTRKNPKVLRHEAIAEEDQPEDRLLLTEFFDSDASANDLSESEEEDAKDHNKAPEKADSQLELLRVVSHVVHCIGLVFGKVEEKEMVSFDSNESYKTSRGPLLPLVAARVLNHIADAILQHFRDDDDSDPQGLWSDAYPFGVRSIGALLDSVLYKAYKCLHGFTLVGSTDQHSIKDNVLPTNADIATERFVPESTRAAAQLYRCIIRARKRTPPSAALETVSAALPPLKESEKMAKIREFLFSTHKSFDVDEILSIVTKTSSWKIPFEAVGEWDQAEDQPRGQSPGDGSIGNGCSSDDELFRVRKGIFALLAQGDLPTYSSSHGGKQEDERSSADRFEQELAKKFNAILNDLSYGNTNTADIRAWMRAGQCALLKAEAICDRLGMSKGFARNKGFYIPEERPPLVPRQCITSLKEEQEREHAARDLGCIDYLGDDLSVYIQHSWSNFVSLETLSLKLMGEDNEHEEHKELEDDGFDSQVKKEIHAMQKKGRLIEWQQAWGGMFVSASKEIAVRCMVLAFFLFHEHVAGMSSKDENLIPELLESLGTKLYTDIAGSQKYGYPMQVMTEHRKRRLANASRVCFQSAVDLARNADDNESDDDKAETWDLIFFVGKCHEKIASTFKMESYDPTNTKKRMFEQHMEKALDSYRTALNEKPDETGEVGGSSHGSTEVLYRIHATRLKCLLLAVDTHEDERDIAEEEALRLTEKHWYVAPSDTDESGNLGIRERVWSVLSDVVSGLAQCRLERSFFHRSVYRHAQALMWAPMLNDPVAGRLEGSKGTVPATKSYRLRGLNYATNAASSALAVMSSLFEKKRTQLVAVWVTTSYPPSTFETVNDSVRKYDSLRGRYISAYIDSLRLCGKRNELETLIRWVSSSKRDLPAIFHATALTKGGRPEKSPTHDSLLVKGRSLSSFTLMTTLKRLANSAMSDVIIQELSSKDLKSAENHLKLAYACHQRLNTSVRDIQKSRAWKYERGGLREAEALCQAFLKLGEKASINVDPNDWSGGGKKVAVLEAALKKCQEIFPSISGAYYSTKKTTQKPKNQSEADKTSTDNDQTKQLAGTKRSFEVEVPEGLAEGETFTTTIRSGENSKKVKLTVPSGKPRMLRFSLDLSTQNLD